MGNYGGAYAIDHDSLAFVEVEFGVAVLYVCCSFDITVEADRCTESRTFHEARGF